jgi:uncharacterized Zn finger protein
MRRKTDGPVQSLMIDMATWCPNCGRKCHDVVDKHTGAISHLCPQCGWTSEDDEEGGDEG